MKDVLEIDSFAFVALCHAIDDASDRGDTGEEIRLAAMPPPELSRWLQDRGYPPLAGIAERLGVLSQAAASPGGLEHPA